MKISEEQADELMGCIRYMYAAWALASYNSETFARSCNGLFNAAKEIDPEGMADAFQKATLGGPE